MSLVIHAPNIHLGGGRTLLSALLPSLAQPAVVQLDERFWPLPEVSPGVRLIRVAPSLHARWRAERRLQSLCHRGDVLLCFGNLPPLFPSAAKTFVFLQNRYLTSLRPLTGMPWPVRLRIGVERVWLRYCLRDALLLVQTESMMEDAREHLGREATVLPFLHEEPLLPDRRNVQHDYLYVASGEPHKNHRRLLEAWVLLAHRGLRPSLCLTLDTKRDAALYAWVCQVALQHGLRVANSPLPPGQIASLYAQSGALIYPSLLESFGLPLLEARQAGMPIVAAERDYVRDVAVPVCSFDPESAMSIARAVMRHQGVARDPAMPGNPAAFLEKLMAL